MKKLLALALTLTLALGLVSPALAAEEPADPLPENWWMDDVAPAADDYVYTDPYEEYAQAHPEEIANLDPDQQLDNWGYYDQTAAEWFYEDNGYDEDTPLEDAVKWKYIEHRLMVEETLAEAETYKAQFPEAWDTFDADSYFLYEYGYYDSVEGYMTQFDILTEEEFVGMMFKDCAEYLDWYDYEPNWWVRPDPVEPQEPTLTLTVNGVATDVAITAGEGVTYADAEALRQFFGPEVVPADQTGLLPIRATAEAAGWDVGWYDSRWSGEQEVQLWDKAGYEGYLADEFGPLNDFFAQALETGGSTLFAETPVTTHQTVTADWTRFSTLDGDETYSMTFDVDMTMGGGVMDATVTFDVAELLKLFPEGSLESLGQMGGFSLTQLRQFLKAGVMEFILDYNTGDIAYNIPLLALVDESLAGWQTETVPGMDGMAEAMDELEDFSFTSTLYAQMISTASYLGAEYAQNEYDQSVALLATFGGKDRFTTQGGKTTYSITTQAMNEAISVLINAESETDTAYSIFKAFDVSYSIDGSGNVTAKAHIRPDTDGIAAAIAKAYESSYYGDPSDSGAMELVMNLLLKGWNMDITASSQGNAQRSTGTMDIHWNNVGKLSVRTTAAQTKGKAPRTVEDVTK